MLPLSHSTLSRDLSLKDYLTVPYCEGLCNLYTVAEATKNTFVQLINRHNDYQNLTLTERVTRLVIGFLLLVPIINSVALFVLHSHYRGQISDPTVLVRKQKIPLEEFRSQVIDTLISHELNNKGTHLPRDLATLIGEFTVESPKELGERLFGEYASYLKDPQRAHQTQEIFTKMCNLTGCDFQEAWENYEDFRIKSGYIHNNGQIDLPNYVGKGAPGYILSQLQKFCSCDSCARVES